MTSKVRVKKPDWLRAKLPSGPEYNNVRNIVDKTNYTQFVKAHNVQIWENAGLEARQP